MESHGSAVTGPRRVLGSRPLFLSFPPCYLRSDCSNVSLRVSLRVGAHTINQPSQWSRAEGCYPLYSFMSHFAKTILSVKETASEKSHASHFPEPVASCCCSTIGATQLCRRHDRGRHEDSPAGSASLSYDSSRDSLHHGGRFIPRRRSGWQFTWRCWLEQLVERLRWLTS